MMNAKDRPENDSAFELARFVYDAQVRQIDRSGATAQGLLTALALLAAFSSPLVVGDITRGLSGAVLGVALAVLFTTIAVAAYWTLRVMYVGRGASTAAQRHSPDRGWLYFDHVANFESPQEFAHHCAHLDEADRVLHLYGQAWHLSLVVKAKSSATVAAVKWTLTALLAFLIVLIIRYLDAVV